MVQPLATLHTSLTAASKPSLRSPRTSLLAVAVSHPQGERTLRGSGGGGSRVHVGAARPLRTGRLAAHTGPGASPARRARQVAVRAEGGEASPQKRVLVPIADGSEEIEAVTVIDVLRRAGAEVVVASVEVDLEGGSRPRLQCEMSRGVKIVADVPIKEVVGRGKDPFDLIAVPGGMPGAERIRDCIPLDAALRVHFDKGRPVAAICAAPAVVFEPKGLLEGFAATAHPAFVDELGGSLEEKDQYARGRVIVDGPVGGGQVITSRGPGTALEWSLCLVELLFGPEKVAEVAGPMVVQPAQRQTPVALEWVLPQ